MPAARISAISANRSVSSTMLADFDEERPDMATNHGALAECGLAISSQAASHTSISCRK